MTNRDDNDDEHDFNPEETVEEARDWLVREVKTSGARKAYAAAIEVLEDSKAPAPARATMATAIFRVGGFFATSKNDDDRVEPHQMTAAQLAKAIARFKNKKPSSSGDDEGGNASGVFD